MVFIGFIPYVPAMFKNTSSLLKKETKKQSHKAPFSVEGFPLYAYMGGVQKKE